MLKDFRVFQLSKKFYQRCKTIRLPAFGKRTTRDRVRYYTMALGSVRECEAILEIENVQDPVAKNLLNQLGAILFKLCQITVENTKLPQKTRDSDKRNEWPPIDLR